MYNIGWEFIVQTLLFHDGIKKKKKNILYEVSNGIDDTLGRSI